MNFSDLKPYQKRHFVTDNADLTDKDIVVGFYRTLEERPVNSAKALEQWLLDRSELDAAVSQAGSILYIRMTCHTDDKAIAGAYTQFIQTVSPAVKPVNDRLNHKYLELCAQFPLDAKRYE